MHWKCLFQQLFKSISWLFEMIKKFEKILTLKWNGRMFVFNLSTAIHIKQIGKYTTFYLHYVDLISCGVAVALSTMNGCLHSWRKHHIQALICFDTLDVLVIGNIWMHYVNALSLYRPKSFHLSSSITVVFEHSNRTVRTWNNQSCYCASHTLFFINFFEVLFLDREKYVISISTTTNDYRWAFFIWRKLNFRTDFPFQFNNKLSNFTIDMSHYEWFMRS